MLLSDPLDQDHVLSPVRDSDLLQYEVTFYTPLRLDCEGRALPGLVRAWEKDSAGRVWTLTLDSRMTAHHVVSAWNDRGAVEESMVLQSAVALDARRISITLIRFQDSVPRILADRSFALEVDPAQRLQGVQFQPVVGLDPRDALDQAVDLLVTRDPALIEYVAGRSEFSSFALPWSRTYTLLQPGSAEPLDLVNGDTGRRSLALDAVSADARPAEPPFWWKQIPDCPAGPPSEPTSVSSRVAYIQGDEVARGLAERMVALAGSDKPLRAAALKRADLAARLRTGSDLAYVVALPRQTLAPCRESIAWPRGTRVEPLIDTRAHVIVRRGAPPLTVDWDGTVRVAP